MSSRPISSSDRHPTIKVLALAFLILIGVALVAESLDFEIPKGYLYFAMAFSVGVEMINIRIRRRGQPVGLHAGPLAPGPGQPRSSEGSSGVKPSTSSR